MKVDPSWEVTVSAANDRTTEAQFLDRHSGLRERVIRSGDFTHWVAGFAPVHLDGDTYWVRARTGANDFGDDRLKDLDQMIMEWLRTRRPDLIPEKPT